VHLAQRKAIEEVAALAVLCIKPAGQYLPVFHIQSRLVLGHPRVVLREVIQCLTQLLLSAAVWGAFIMVLGLRYMELQAVLEVALQTASAVVSAGVRLHKVIAAEAQDLVMQVQAVMLLPVLAAEHAAVAVLGRQEHQTILPGATI
jgi:urease accessory protein UreF